MSGGKPIGAVVLVSALLLTAAVAVPAAAGGQAQSSAERDITSVAAEHERNEGRVNETADEVYLTETGAVLVFENESDDNTDRFEYGADIATGLVDIVAEGELEDNDNATGQFTFEYANDSVDVSGSLRAYDAAEDVGSLSLTADGAHTRNRSRADVSLEVVSNESMEVDAAVTTGELVLAPDSFRLDANVSVGPVDEENVTGSFAATMREDGDALVVDVQQRHRPENPEQYETAEQAEETIRQQVALVAFALDTETSVTLHEHEFRNGTGPPTVSLDYTVRLDSGRAELNDLLVESVLNESDSVNVSAEQRRAVRAAISNVTVDEVSVSGRQDDSGSFDGEMAIELSGYETAYVHFLDVVAAENGSVTPADVERLDARLDAQSAAGLVQTVTWDGRVDSSASPAEGGTDGSQSDAATTMNVSVSYRTENWGAYVQETQRRAELSGLQTGLVVETSMEDAGSGYTVDLAATVTREDLVDTAYEYATSGETELSESQDTREFAHALAAANLSVARGELTFTNETYETRLAAQFDDLGQFGTTYLGNGNLSHLYGQTENDSVTRTYVFLENESLTEDTIRNLDLVDGETEIYAEDEHDRSFPTLDTDETAAYLGVETGENGEQGESERGGVLESGIGLVAVLAVLVVVVIGLFRLVNRE